MNKLPETVYAPGSPLRRPGRFLHAMMRDLWISRGLAWRLFVRDINAQYRQSLLGIAWAFIPPLVASAPFIFLQAQGIVEMGHTPIAYPAYAMIGTILWQVFVDALNMPLKTVAASKAMLARINFPREAILLSGLGQVACNFVVRLILLIGVFAWFRLSVPATAVLLPVGILALVVAGFAVGVALTPLGLLYQDVAQTMPIATTFLLFLTPVLYPVPAAGPGAMLAQWNPLGPLIGTTREWLTMGTSNQLAPFLGITGSAVLLLFFAWMIYRLALPHVIARVGN